MNGPKRELNLIDAVCLVVGVIVGAGVYSLSPMVASATTSEIGVLGLWVLGGLLSLMGALCYAELAAAYPRAGGDYVYLTHAYGPWAGFLFGWAQLTVVRPGDIATMALIFARHAEPLLKGTILDNPRIDWLRVLAAGIVVVLTIVHCLGVRRGKWTQNILTAAKILGIALVVSLAFAAPTATNDSLRSGSSSVSQSLSLALIFVLFCYGGWNEMAYLAGEIRDPQRNVLRGLLVGTVAVAVIYVILNAAFLHVLGRDGLAASGQVAADAIAPVLGDWGKPLINSLICVSTLGAANGLIFSGSRISYALGTDYRVFQWLGRWDERGAPRRALIVQCLLSVVLIVYFGSEIETLITTSVAVYTFYTFTCLAVIVLRFRDPKVTRPYEVTGFPVTVLIFVAVSLWLLNSAIQYKPLAAAVIGGVVVLGGVVYLVQGRRTRPVSAT